MCLCYLPIKHQCSYVNFVTRRVATRAVTVTLSSGKGHVVRVAGGLQVCDGPLEGSNGVSKGTEGTVALAAKRSTDGSAMTCKIDKKV